VVAVPVDESGSGGGARAVSVFTGEAPLQGSGGTLHVREAYHGKTGSGKCQVGMS